METFPLSAAVCCAFGLCGAGWVHGGGGPRGGRGTPNTHQVLASGVGRQQNLPNVNTFTHQL